jgi:hypothetical protein
MRFACQSCGKAYNLPEERIAEKSNVKLKCRVCGAIVEVKRQGELVAHVLDETEDKRMARVSEAPAPLTSISPDDDDDPDGATVSISESSLNDRGPLELAIPGAAPTGFSPAAASALSSSAFSSSAFSSPLSSSSVLSSSGLSSSGLSSSGGFGSEGASAAAESGLLAQSALAQGEGVERRDGPNVVPPLPPLSPSSLPPPPVLRLPDARAHEALENGSASNGAGVSNGSAAFFGDAVSAEVDESLTPELKAPVAAALLGNGISGGAMTGGAASTSQLGASAISSELADFPAPEGEAAGRDPLFKIKMLAAFATGVLIDRIVSGLFQ